MTGKAVKTLRKLTPEQRTWLAAVLLAIAVHILLLVIFQLSPPERPSAYGELAKVVRIELDSQSNQEFARWLENHTPALLNSVDRKSGYSRLLSQSGRRKAMEDLPSPLLLSSPRTLSPVQVNYQKQQPVENLLPDETFHLTGGKSAVTPAVKNCFMRNNQALELPQGIVWQLKNEFDKVKITSDKVSATVIAVDPPRLEGMLPPATVVQSCGNTALDDAAMQLLRYGATAFPQEKKKFSGEITVLWNFISMLDKEQK